MKRIVYILLPLLLAACNSKPDMVELTEWQFEYNGERYPATVPGFIHTDLMAHGLIPDPYYGTNEDSVQWLANRKWKYRTVLSKEELSRMVRNEIPPNDTIWLTFEGLAGRAEILVQRYLGSSAAAIGDFVDNMFVEHTVPIEIWGKFDSIVIQLFFQYPYDSDSLREVNYGITLPERRAFTRIAPYQQGWDWGPKLRTCGIWKRVYITNRKPDNPDNPEVPGFPGYPGYPGQPVYPRLSVSRRRMSAKMLLSSSSVSARSMAIRVCRKSGMPLNTGDAARWRRVCRMPRYSSIRSMLMRSCSSRMSSF